MQEKSQRFYYSCLGSGFHLLFTAVSQCFSTETWIFSERCECVHVNVNEGTWQRVCVREGATGFEIEVFFLKPSAIALYVCV